ncbi:hypothetical protein [Yinghuangia soli]|uniref:Ig-like domain-containing protein n=1 Tax=Yinghuangia soli TaxID=2908204 RepID=A0AA41Q4R9_9ACTN|nr:hypothetical protein [Yinghuangia soli]MCF2531533.1 hypothetical protein [Yinghuangia soli]
MRTPRAVALAVIPLGLVAPIVAPAAAHAEDSTVTYTCQVPVVGSTQAAVTMSLTATPRNPKAGEAVTFTWKSEPVAQLAGPVAYDANSIQVTAVLTLSGAAESTVRMMGPRANPPVPAGSPLPLGEMTGTATLAGDGPITVTPGALVVDVQRQPRPITVPCEPASPAPFMTLSSAAAADESDDDSILPVAVGVGAGVVVLAGAAVWLLRRRRVAARP